MFEHGVCYGKAVNITEVQQEDTIQVQIREAVPHNPAPPGVTVDAPAMTATLQSHIAVAPHESSCRR